jgi:hypothetical protein
VTAVPSSLATTLTSSTRSSLAAVSISAKLNSLMAGSSSPGSSSPAAGSASASPSSRVALLASAMRSSLAARSTSVASSRSWPSRSAIVRAISRCSRAWLRLLSLDAATARTRCNAPHRDSTSGSAFVVILGSRALAVLTATWCAWSIWPRARNTWAIRKMLAATASGDPAVSAQNPARSAAIQAASVSPIFTKGSRASLTRRDPARHPDQRGSGRGWASYPIANSQLRLHLGCCVHGAKGSATRVLHVDHPPSAQHRGREDPYGWWIRRRVQITSSGRPDLPGTSPARQRRTCRPPAVVQEMGQATARAITMGIMSPVVPIMPVLPSRRRLQSRVAPDRSHQ